MFSNLTRDLPSALSMTLAEPDSITATQELVVPRSMPMTLQGAKGQVHSRDLLAEAGSGAGEHGAGESGVVCGRFQKFREHCCV